MRTVNHFQCLVHPWRVHLAYSLSWHARVKCQPFSNIHNQWRRRAWHPKRITSWRSETSFCEVVSTSFDPSSYQRLRIHTRQSQYHTTIRSRRYWQSTTHSGRYLIVRKPSLQRCECWFSTTKSSNKSRWYRSDVSPTTPTVTNVHTNEPHHQSQLQTITTNNERCWHTSVRSWVARISGANGNLQAVRGCQCVRRSANIIIHIALFIPVERWIQFQHGQIHQGHFFVVFGEFFQGVATQFQSIHYLWQLIL